MLQPAYSGFKVFSSILLTDGGNKWNAIRDDLFMPMAILFLLPGAIIAQTRALVSQSFDALGPQVDPFDGLLRSIVAIFLIPASYLVVNEGIDIANSLTSTISRTYTRVFGSDMYERCILRPT